MSRQQAEAETERLAMILEALDRIKQVAKPGDVELIARELGVAQWMNTKQESSNGKSR